MFVVISYDIPDDKRRNEVFKTLKDYGAHVQYSVFECDLKPEVFRKLRQELKEIINKEEDNVRFYVLSEEDLKKRRIWGQERTEAEVRPFYLVRSSGSKE
ncbi:MAG: CRISPR-associated endoribonuclease Cas2 3 [Chloroflexota bacterium]|nr:MAG: CRISPR-associated endoribonuclease Cas2 3 [Chloroflexota bacterium]